MGKYFGVFGDLFLFNDHLDGGKPFYENAVLRPVKSRPNANPQTHLKEQRPDRLISIGSLDKLPFRWK